MEISEVTRRSIVDDLVLRKVAWSGRLEDAAFLSRLYPLKKMRSDDHRFKDAAGDIHQHRTRNFDWDDDWVFYDRRFNLMSDDREFLDFLVETLHPIVRPDEKEAKRLCDVYNEFLRRDGWEVYEVGAVSGHPVYAARKTIVVPAALHQVEKTVKPDDLAYLSRQLTRMETAIEEDPELAVGTAKELIETCCSTILVALGEQPDKNWTLARLAKETTLRLDIAVDSIGQDAKGVSSIRQILGSLAGIVSGMAELRNEYGTGHGRPLRSSTLTARHARLAVGAASTFAAFLFETYEQRHSSAG